MNITYLGQQLSWPQQPAQHLHPKSKWKTIKKVIVQPMSNQEAELTMGKNTGRVRYLQQGLLEGKIIVILYL